MRPNQLTVDACKLLGDVVRFIRGPNPPERAIVGTRWVTPKEWALLLTHGLKVAPVMVPPPERSRSEKACPCPGCARCCCEWVGNGHRQCKRPRCVCPRSRPPIRLEFRRISQTRAEIVIARAGVALYTVGVWREKRGWDLGPAGEAKQRSLRAVLPEVCRRAGTSLALRTLEIAEQADGEEQAHSVVPVRRAVRCAA